MPVNGDLVEFDPETFKVLRIIEDGGFTRQKYYKYSGEPEAEKIYWEDKSYIVEGCGKRMLVITKKKIKNEPLGNAKLQTLPKS